MGEERRKGLRIPVQVWAENSSGAEMRIWLDADAVPSGDAFCYATVDIGPGGLFLESENPLPPGSRVALVLTLPGQSEPLFVRGTVVRAVQPGDPTGPLPGMGVAFDPLEPEIRRRLDAFLSSVRG